MNIHMAKFSNTYNLQNWHNEKTDSTKQTLQATDELTQKQHVDEKGQNISACFFNKQPENTRIKQDRSSPSLFDRISLHKGINKDQSDLLKKIFHKSAFTK